MTRHFAVELESKACPLGCLPGDDALLTGHDRLYDLPGEFTVVKCRGCGLMRTNPRPTPAAMGFYYPETYTPYETTQVRATTVAPPPAPWWRRSVRRLLDTDTKKLPHLHTGRMLEIGCASGAFLHHMAGLGWHVEGVEFSPQAAEAARALGYAVQSGPFETATMPLEPYDLIVGWMVFEHLHEPMQVLEKLWHWTKPDGWLVLSVPDAGALEFTVFKDAWYALHLPHHLYHYTLETLGLVLERSGWHIERVFWHSNPTNLLQSLRYRCRERGWQKAADYLLDIVAGRRQRYARLLLGRVLGMLHASGRMTVWASRV